ncbi:MAG: hypothetical protein SGILL_008654 [Bacillariaceae sp.]
MRKRGERKQVARGASKKQKVAPPTHDDQAFPPFPEDLKGMRVKIPEDYEPVLFHGTVKKKMLRGPEKGRWQVKWNDGTKSCVATETIQECKEDEALPDNLVGTKFSQTFTKRRKKPVIYDATIVGLSDKYDDHWIVKYDGYDSDANDHFPRGNLEHNIMAQYQNGKTKNTEKPASAEPEPIGYSYDETKNEFCERHGKDDEVVESVLKTLTAPYCWNQVWAKLNEHSNNWWAKLHSTNVVVGLKVRKLFLVDLDTSHEQFYQGKVTSSAGGGRWNVLWSDGEKNIENEKSKRNEPLTTATVLDLHKNWVDMNSYHPVDGRMLNFVELFSGTGTVARKFEMMLGDNDKRKWNVETVDIDSKGNPSINKSIFELTLEDLSTMPDSCWASPVCTSMSTAAGRTHRSAKTGDYCRTPKAMESDKQLSRLRLMLKFFLHHNPNFIFVIENPVGQMSKLPLITAMVTEMELTLVRVDYCRFGEEYKKPTHLWTNSPELAKLLDAGEFKCTRETCEWERSDKSHPMQFQEDKNGSHDFAKIPDQLAHFVASSVDAILRSKGVQRTKPIEITAKMQQEFIKLLHDPK